MNIIKDKRSVYNCDHTHPQVTYPYIESYIHKEVKNYMNVTGMENTSGQTQFREQLMRNLFDQMLFIIAHEGRYGLALNNVEDYEYIKELLVHLAKNHFIFKSIIHLKNWDLNSFLHLLDVFILANLYVKRYHINDPIDFAIATLLLDIGKVQIPKSMLKKKILTPDEKAIYNKHHLWSFQMLGNNCSKYVKTVVLNHNKNHSRCMIFDEEIEKSLRIISVIDMYSSLTRKTHRENSLISAKALEKLINQPDQYSESIVAKFMDLLHIYPIGCHVLLSNGNKARITKTNVNTPFLPQVTENSSASNYYLPINQSIMISRCLTKEENKPDQKNWELLIDLVTNNDHYQAYHIFVESVQEKNSEQVYRDVVVPAIKKILDNGKDPYMVEKLFLKWMWENFSVG